MSLTPKPHKRLSQLPTSSTSKFLKSIRNTISSSKQQGYSPSHCMNKHYNPQEVGPSCSTQLFQKPSLSYKVNEFDVGSSPNLINTYDQRSIKNLQINTHQRPKTPLTGANKDFNYFYTPNIEKNKKARFFGTHTGIDQQRNPNHSRIPSGGSNLFPRRNSNSARIDPESTSSKYLNFGVLNNQKNPKNQHQSRCKQQVYPASPQSSANKSQNQQYYYKFQDRTVNITPYNASSSPRQKENKHPLYKHSNRGENSSRVSGLKRIELSSSYKNKSARNHKRGKVVQNYSHLKNNARKIIQKQEKDKAFNRTLESRAIKNNDKNNDSNGAIDQSIGSKYRSPSPKGSPLMEASKRKNYLKDLLISSHKPGSSSNRGSYRTHKGRKVSKIEEYLHKQGSQFNKKIHSILNTKYDSGVRSGSGSQKRMPSRLARRNDLNEYDSHTFNFNTSGSKKSSLDQNNSIIDFSDSKKGSVARIESKMNQRSNSIESSGQKRDRLLNFSSNQKDQSLDSQEKEQKKILRKNMTLGGIGGVIKRFNLGSWKANQSSGSQKSLLNNKKRNIKLDLNNTNTIKSTSSKRGSRSKKRTKVGYFPGQNKANSPRLNHKKTKSSIYLKKSVNTEHSLGNRLYSRQVGKGAEKSNSQSMKQSPRTTHLHHKSPKTQRNKNQSQSKLLKTLNSNNSPRTSSHRNGSRNSIKTRNSSSRQNSNNLSQMSALNSNVNTSRATTHRVQSFMEVNLQKAIRFTKLNFFEDLGYQTYLIQKNMRSCLSTVYDCIKKYIDCCQDKAISKFAEVFNDEDSKNLFESLQKLERWSIVTLFYFVVSDPGKYNSSPLLLDDLYDLAKQVWQNHNLVANWVKKINKMHRCRWYLTDQNRIYFDVGLEDRQLVQQLRTSQRITISKISEM